MSANRVKYFIKSILQNSKLNREKFVNNKKKYIITNAKRNNYNMIIIDEIHELYQGSLQIFDKVLKYNFEYRWGMTATPFVNNDSLYNLIRFFTGKNFTNQRIANVPRIQDYFMKLLIKNTITPKFGGFLLYLSNKGIYNYGKKIQSQIN